MMASPVMQPVYMTPPPPNMMAPPQGHSDLFKSSEWRDVWMLAIYVLCLLTFFGITGYTGYEFFKAVANLGGIPAEARNSITRFDEETAKILIALTVALASSLLLVFLNTLMMYKAPKVYINIMFLYMPILVVCGAIACFIIKDCWPVGIMLLVVFAIQMALFVYWRSRFPFSAELMKKGVDGMRDYPGVFSVMLVTVLALFIVLAGFGLTAARWMLMETINIQMQFLSLHSDDIRQKLSEAIGLTGFSVIFSIWTINILMNLASTIYGGVYSVYYFKGRDQTEIHSPTAVSAKRALSISFGSIALGSLVTPIVSFLRGIVGAFSDRTTPIGAMVAYGLGWSISAERYFNKYGFLQLATYNRSFVDSGKNARATIRRNRIDELDGDHVVGIAVVLGSFFITGVVVAICSITAAFMSGQPTIDFFALGIASAVSFIVTIIICAAVNTAINTGVTTIFLCMAEDPTVVQSKDPELYGMLTQKYGNVIA